MVHLRILAARSWNVWKIVLADTLSAHFSRTFARYNQLYLSNVELDPTKFYPVDVFTTTRSVPITLWNRS